MAKMGDIWYPALLGLAEQYRYGQPPTLPEKDKRWDWA
jgi:hypothetical protein